MCISILSDQSVLANAAPSVTDSGDLTAAMTRQVELVDRRNAELESQLHGKPVCCHV